MDDMDASTTLVPGAHRAIRRVEARESAFAGALVVAGEAVRVRVDASEADAALWRYAGAEHIAGVRDLVRRVDGHDVLLPWCPDRVDAFLGRRSAAGRPLAAGEIVTLTGSMLRAVEEAGDDPLTGSWWLADDARPLFVPGEGAGCIAATREVVARLREECTDRAMQRVLGEIERMPDDPRVVARSLARWESELSELAAPRALEREVFAPERVSDIPVHRAVLPQDALRVTEQRTGAARRARPSSAPLPAAARVTSVVDRLRERCDAWLDEVRARMLRRLTGGGPHAGGPGEPAPPARPRRARMLAVGGAAAGAVLLGGLLWPVGGEDSGAVEPDATERMPSAGAPENATKPAPTTPGGPDPQGSDAADSPPEPQDVVRAAEHLLVEIAACLEDGDRACAGSIAAGAADAVMARLTGADAVRGVEPVEDYGDLAVLKLGAAGTRGEQMLVLERQGDGWLVRDVYDVADQPSGEG